jgi:SAM-dependent methyltransferase
MTASTPDLGRYWRTELESFDAFRRSTPGATYPDWQPTKWQSLRNLLDTTLDHCTAAGDPPRSAIELGCGSSTLVIQLAERGLQTVGLDREPEALALAREACAGLPLAAAPTFVAGDFLDAEVRAGLGNADLVLSGGVIEHWLEAGQREVLQAHLDVSRRWVLLTVPNLDSPVFRSFVSWSQSAGRFYEDEHFDISVPDLAGACGCRVAVVDGCHLFLGRSEYYIAGDAELEAFYGDLRGRLVETGGARYESFPRLDFTAADIDVLAGVEREATGDERMRFGFLHFYLLDSAPRASSAS